MSIGVYTSRDTATAVLRKLGIEAKNYNQFITKTEDGRFECDIEAAEASLKPKKKAAKQPAAKRATISGRARELIISGKTNAEVWAALQKEFSLDDSKKHYPSWYRCELRRKGELPDYADYSIFTQKNAPLIVEG